MKCLKLMSLVWLLRLSPTIPLHKDGEENYSYYIYYCTLQHEIYHDQWRREILSTEVKSRNTIMQKYSVGSKNPALKILCE